MKRMVAGLVLVGACVMAAMAGGCYAVRATPPSDAKRADDLARGVAMASGVNVWPRVTTLSFTSVVRQGGDVKMSRTHTWNVKAGTDTVSSGERSTTVDLNKADMDDPAQAEAYKAWADDTFWLVAPLRLLDAGVTRQYEGRREVAGKTYEVLRVTFPGMGTAAAAGNTYELYVDPFTSLIAYSDAVADADGMATRTTWEQYRHTGGFKLSTFHKTGDRTVSIERLMVATE